MATALPKVNYQNIYFPSHLVDPDLKDKAWHIQYAKAAYQTWKIGRAHV